MRGFAILALVLMLFVAVSCPSGGGSSSSTKTTTTSKPAADSTGKAPAVPDGVLPDGLDAAAKPLPERLADVAAKQKEELPADLLAELDAELAMVAEAGLAENVPMVGEMIADFTTEDIYGEEFWLGGTLLDQPVVLFTTRGGWCPFCDVTMSAVEEFMPHFTKGGAKVVMISPQRVDLLKEVAEAKGLEYTVISDSEYIVLEELGLAWGLSEHMRQLLLESGVDLVEMNGNEERLMLPFPAFYVIDCDGTIKYAHAGLRCTERPDLREVSQALYDLGYGPDPDEDMPEDTGGKPAAADAIAQADYPETFDGDPSLTQQLDEERLASAASLPAKYNEAVDGMIDVILEGDFWANVTDVGQPAPPLVGLDLYGDERSLEQYLGDGPVIVVFFRGGWCPFCSLQLRALERYYPEFRDRGAELIAVSPDEYENLLDDHGIVPYTYDVIWDINGQSMLEWGLAYTLTDELALALADLGVDVAARNAMDWPMLPVPATFIVNGDGTVVWRDVMIDYTKRVDPETILAVLDGMEE
ncbi:AhpC/TSA family protein [bacterium]|nr:AhpC/TSA family protein [bacterium]